MQWSFARGTTSAAVALVALASVTSPVLARPARPPARERTAAAVMAVEHEWLAALHRRDVKTLERILGREFIDSDFQGEAITRARYLAYFAHPLVHSMPRARQDFAGTRVRFIAGGNVAIVTGIVITRTAATSKAGNPFDRSAVKHSRFTDVFLWRGGRWQAVTGQETHFTPATG